MKFTFTLFKLFLFVTLAGILTVQHANAQWVLQTSPAAGTLETVFFTSPTTGYISGGFQYIYKTTNGGTTWTSLGNYTAKNIYFYNANTGYTAGVSGLQSMKRTDNAGSSWTILTPPNSSSIWGTFATSASTVYFIATDGKVHKSINSGLTFTSYNLTGSSYPTSIIFTDVNTGYIVDESAYIWKTTNAGTSWTNTFHVTGTILKSVYFVNSLTGFVCGAGGKISKTTDGGATWIPLTTGTSYYFQSIYFADANNGLAVGLAGAIMRTSDGGTTWTTESAPSTADFFSVRYLNSTTAIIVGSGGVILKNSSLTGVSELQKSNIVQTFPNPSNDLVNIEVPAYLRDPSFRMFDFAGREVFSGKITTGSFQLKKENFKSGIYLISFYNDKEFLETKKIVLE